MSINLLSEHGCFGGVQRFYKHASRETRGRDEILRLSAAAGARAQGAGAVFPLGTDLHRGDVSDQGHAQQTAAELGLMLVSPDTSPREPRLPGDADSWDFGQGAGFYVDATQAPWADELPHVQLRDARAAGRWSRRICRRRRSAGIFGHSMGGHGALICALRNPAQYRSVSAFAPIAAPLAVRLGGARRSANYLGQRAGRLGRLRRDTAPRGAALSRARF